MSRHETFVLRDYTFTTWTTQDWRGERKHMLSHEYPGRPAAGHALGPATGLSDRAAVMRVADEHAIQMNDIGNCRGLIPIQRGFGQAIHAAEIPRWTGYPVYQRTICGLTLSAPAMAFRVSSGGLERVTCRKCRGR